MRGKAKKSPKTSSAPRRHKDHSERLTNVHSDGIDWSTRTVWIASDLTEEKGYKLVPGIRMLDETKGTIKVAIMSCGGCENAGFAIYDALKACQSEVITIGLGEVYSIAALVFQAGERRVVFPHVDLMMHNGTTQVEGGDINTDYIEEIAKEAVRNNARYHRAIAARCGIDLQKVVQWCKDEKYFLSEEVVQEGLADEIVHTWKEI